MATYEGMGSCDISEYHAAFDNRLQLEQMTCGELYVARFEIENRNAGYRIIGRLGLTAVSDEGSEITQFQMLNDDLQPHRVPNVGYMHDGIWNPFTAMTTQAVDNGVHYRLLNGCFGEYDETPDWELQMEYGLMLEPTHDSQLILPTLVPVGSMLAK